MGNCLTGQIVSPEMFKALQSAGLADDFQEVPADLAREAEARLAGDVSALVEKIGAGDPGATPLTDWMARHRQKVDTLAEFREMLADAPPQPFARAIR